jgi:hypothetical protein
MGRLHHPEPIGERRFGPAIGLLDEVRSKGGRLGRETAFLAVAVAEELIDILRMAPEAAAALELMNLDPQTIRSRVRVLLQRLHTNRHSDHYVTLLLPQTASRGEITHRWKTLMLLYHPDRNPSADVDEGLVKRLNGAYQVLKDPDARTRYDRTRTQRAYMLGLKGRNRERGQRARRLFLHLIVPVIVALCFGVVAAVIVFDRKTEAYRLEQAARDAGVTSLSPEKGGSIVNIPVQGHSIRDE